MRRALAVLVICALLVSCQGPAAESEVVVFAAASLRDVLTEVGRDFTDRSEIATVFNFAGSNVLARQIEAAPRADVFLSANQQWMDHLEKRGLLKAGSRRDLLANRLVVIAHRETTFAMTSPQDLPSLPMRHLALGDPAAVPAGIYARLRLQALPHGEGSLWTALEGRVAPMADVRAALHLVESSRDVLGIVYRTDAISARGNRILFEFPTPPGPRIHYPAAVLAAAPNGAAAQRFLAFLAEPAAQAAFRAHGFLTLPESGV
ncbi:MAG: molybdate ABC transporter substrate-binding protein [Acidobacteriota bacterium]